jgi:hypothetical protein
MHWEIHWRNNRNALGNSLGRSSNGLMHSSTSGPGPRPPDPALGHPGLRWGRLCGPRSRPLVSLDRAGRPDGRGPGHRPRQGSAGNRWAASTASGDRWAADPDLDHPGLRRVRLCGPRWGPLGRARPCPATRRLRTRTSATCGLRWRGCDIDQLSCPYHRAQGRISVRGFVAPAMAIGPPLRERLFANTCSAPLCHPQ